MVKRPALLAGARVVPTRSTSTDPHAADWGQSALRSNQDTAALFVFHPWKSVFICGQNNLWNLAFQENHLVLLGSIDFY